jgi:prepilin-type N-terminal cleavage/methylation domain-containing protein
MFLAQSHRPVRGRQIKAFSLVEVMVSASILAIMLIGLYGGISFGFSQTWSSRENLRATQILEERMEILRLYNWDQIINQPGYIPATFTAPFYPDGSNGGFSYSGTVTLTNAPMTETYSNDFRLVQIQVTWNSGGQNHSRSMSTLVSQFGLQRYVY